MDEIHLDGISEFVLADGVLRYGSRPCVSDSDGLRDQILEEAHRSAYIVHSGSTKMYHDLKVAYKLALPPDMSLVHPVFHISMLRKCISDPCHVIIPQSVEIDRELSYEEQPVEIVDAQVRKLRSKEIPMVKVLWRNNSIEECIWETESDMRSRYPFLIP
ncbi:uncharacterized protein LOC126656949 [Mercurialis annua]|uniref:uncharacterized protein LOC126656949 n=1 Tax=Mercurialis annua TaxID=3986 RepID=UPI00215FD062|nr:uncharacterized protein LOC126656949 [Mercurialis annua]